MKGRLTEKGRLEGGMTDREVLDDVLGAHNVGLLEGEHRLGTLKKRRKKTVVNMQTR